MCLQATKGRSSTRAQVLIALAVLTCALTPGAAHAFLSEPTVVPLFSQQSNPVFVDGALVFEQRTQSDQPADLWFVRLATGDRLALADGPGSQYDAAAFGRYVVFVDEQQIGQTSTFRLVVVDTADRSNRATLVPATTTPLWTPAASDGVLVWAQGPSGGRGLFGMRIDGDLNGVPDVLEGGAAPAIVPVWVDRDTDSFSPALGPGRLVFASRRALGDAQVKSVPIDARSAAIADPERAVLLAEDTGNRDPDPATAGQRAVWRHSSASVRIYDFESGASVDASAGPGWSMIVAPATDGVHVAWQAFGSTLGPQGAPIHQVFMRDTTGAVFRASPVSANQFAPAFGSGMLAWGDSRWMQAGQAPNLAHVCLSSRRVQGGDRFATAVRASELAFPGGSEYVLISTGRNWPDALGGSSLAGVLDAPILLVERDALPAATRAEIARLGARKAVIVGGTGAVGEIVQVALEQMGLGVERIGGRDRYETAEQIATRVRSLLGSSDQGTVLIATGRDYPDALSAAPLAVRQRWPLLLIDPAAADLTEGTRGFLRGSSTAIILGGRSAVPERVVSEARAAGVREVRRLEGPDRYATAVAVAGFAVTDPAVARPHAWERVGITTGVQFPDALSGGVLQGKSGSVMLLSRPDALPGQVAATLTTHASAIDTVAFFGGTGALSEAVRDSVLRSVR